MNSSTTPESNYVDTWVPEPTTRGTWSILWSCTFTIILCVWSALHLNIPHHKASARSQFLTKLKWAATAIFAPELVVYCAWQQYYVARKVRDKMRKLMERQQGKQETSNSTSRADSTPDKLIDLQYGFYVVMGGFAVDVSSLYDNGDQITLTPFGVVYFAEVCGVSAFLISPKEISDKSKADTLAKVLVFFQVSWILLDYMNRWVQNHHLSVLEVHTLAHAACALVMWGFWLSKPLNVGSATLIQPHRFRREAAGESFELIDLEHTLALVLMQSLKPSRASWLKLQASECLAGDRLHGRHAFDSRETESSDLVIYPDDSDGLFMASQNDPPITTVNHQLASLVLDSDGLHFCGRDFMEANVKARIVTGQALCGRIGPGLHVLTHDERLWPNCNEEQLHACEEKSIPLSSLTEPGRSLP